MAIIEFSRDDRLSTDGNCVLPTVQCRATISSQLRHSNQGEHMKIGKIALTLALCLAGVAVCYASDPNMGTWKLNEAKSKFSPGATKNTTVVYAPAGDQVKVTTDGTTGDGTPVQTEWAGQFDGKDYPLTGDPSANSRSYKKVNDHTLELTNKKDGKVTTNGRIVVSADGKTRTLTVSGTGAAGKKITYTALYDKQ
jgi:hypothetical protein